MTDPAADLPGMRSSLDPRESPSLSRMFRDPAPASGSLLHAATDLAWLAPSAVSLSALARLPATAWPTLRLDPGAVLLLVRSSALDPALPFSEALLADPATLERALRLSEQPSTFIDWSDHHVRPVYDTSVQIARIARSLALRSGRVDPEQAWTAGLLAPLGWLALAAVAPTRVAAALFDSAFARDPVNAPERLLGADPVAIARRLARRWELPGWLAGLVSHLQLPLEHARRFGVDPALFCTLRLAVHLARLAGGELGLIGQTDLAAEELFLGLRLADFNLLETVPDESTPIEWVDPHRQPLLRELLVLAAENRRLRNTPRLARLEGELDGLHSVLGEQVRGESERLRSAKLSGLAEFAAGASHEINNPLAVISGQAQYILAHEADWLAPDPEAGACQALHAIIQQTRRIHTILRDLMQFARPAPPRPSWIDLPTLMGEVAASLEETASARRVRVEVITRPERLSALFDPEQVRSALTCLLRNAIEAAPLDGWARLALQEPGPGDRLEVHVEDSGTGPAPEQRPHLFDPFYSGRSAGRGRGLGLPLAWRLARQQGGDVFLEPIRPGQPTRFVLSLPRHVHPAGINAA
ncbi:MAG: histidine kinase dimerization/phospho-acceptor domain-containing protein [Gemmataceae bacterium]